MKLTITFWHCGWRWITKNRIRNALYSENHTKKMYSTWCYLFVFKLYFCILTLKLTSWSSRWLWIIKIISKMDFPVKNIRKRGITLFPSCISNKNHIWPWKPYIRSLDLEIYALTLKCHLIIKIVPQVDFSVKNTLKRGNTLAAICICLKKYFRSFDLGIDLLTLNMTLNHHNNIINRSCSQNHTNFFYYICS